MSKGLEREELFSGHLGENTWNARLSETLRNRGFHTADFELIFPTLRGIRKPDVPFQCERGLCFVSAKLGSNKETDAVASAYEYVQSIGEVNAVAEAFSLTYPSKKEKEFHLRVLANKEHQTLSWILGSLDETAEKISSIVKKDWESAQIGKESTVTSAIRVLRSGVVEFSSALTKTPPEDFENIFGGKYFFESVLGYEKIEEKKSNDLKAAAAYLFVNQILFYEILARETKDFPSIAKEDLSRPEFLKPKYFDLVLKIDYRPIFNFDIASKLKGKDTGDACKKIILAIRTLFPEEIDHDVIGKVFHNVIPLEIRKVVAAYFTNNAAGDLLARLSIFSENDKILDPACGSGTLLVSSYKRKLQLTGHELNESTHQRFIQKELTGIDIMPFSAHLAAVNLALLGLPHKTDILRIAIGDSTKRKPGDKIEPAREVLKEAFKSRTLSDYLADAVKPTRSKVQAGAVALDEKGAKPILLEKADVVIMNPPFTSCDNLPSEYKIELKNRFLNPSAYLKCITGKLSFQAYFLLLADRFLDNNGRIACVLPFSTFVGKAFRKIDEFIVKRYSIKCIIWGMGRSAYSDNTNLTEILFVGKKGVPEKNHKFVLVATKNPPTEWSDNDVIAIQQQIDKTEETGLKIETNQAVTLLSLQNDIIKENVGLNQLVQSFDRKFVEVLEVLHPTTIDFRHFCK
jgi:tRNA1(Val) A37 N6-methylase TrmN6